MKDRSMAAQVVVLEVLIVNGVVVVVDGREATAWSTFIRNTESN